MSNIVTRGEVIYRSFNREISESKLNDSVIQTAQNKYIRPILGDDFYELFIEDMENSDFTDLLELVKESLSWWVKYISLPEVFVEIADTGVKVLETQNTTQITDQRFIELRNSILVICDDKTSQITDYLEDEDTDLSAYMSSDNVDRTTSIAGGIITRKRSSDYYEDDCPEKWEK